MYSSSPLLSAKLSSTMDLELNRSQLVFVQHAQHSYCRIFSFHAAFPFSSNLFWPVDSSLHSNVITILYWGKDVKCSQYFIEDKPTKWMATMGSHSQQTNKMDAHYGILPGLGQENRYHLWGDLLFLYPNRSSGALSYQLNVLILTSTMALLIFVKTDIGNEIPGR